MDLGKQRTFEQYLHDTSSAPPGQAQTMLCRIARSRRRRLTKNSLLGPLLDPRHFLAYAHFTSFTTVKCEMPLLPFEVTSNLKAEILSAVKHAPRGKASGPDGLFAEMFKLAPELSSEILTHLLAACGRTSRIPQDWNRATLIPFFKKGNPRDPGNYRPISLLSHCRKILEHAVDKYVKKFYTVQRVQCGFKKLSGCDTAVLHTLAAIKDGHEYITSLDLTKAFDKMPRHILSRLLRRKLPTHVASILMYFLQPIHIQTIGDDSELTFLSNLGVPQGSAISPTLYNIFMDVFAESFKTAPRSIATSPATFLADNVILRAFTAPGLQLLLDIATDWAFAALMTWNTSIGKSCVLVPPSGETNFEFRLAGARLEYQQETEYLGISLSSTGVTPSSTIKRMESAKARVLELARIGVHGRGFKPELSIRVYKTAIRSMTEYLVYLVEPTAEVLQAHRQLENAFFSRMFGAWSANQQARFRFLCRLESFELRQAHLAAKLVHRLKTLRACACSLPYGTERSYVMQQTNHALHLTLKVDRLQFFTHHITDKSDPHAITLWHAQKEWETFMRSKGRRTPRPRGKELPPFMTLSKAKHRLLCAHWLSHRFPYPHQETLRHENQALHLALATLERLMRKNGLSDRERQALADAIDTIQCICPPRKKRKTPQH